MTTQYVIVEVEGYEGEFGAIEVRNLDPDAPNPGRVYCVAAIEEGGVARFVDWGYASVADARAAWPAA